MKLAFFDDFRLGVVDADSIVEVSAAIDGIPHTSPQNLMSHLIERFANHRPRIERLATGGKRVELSKVRLRPPLPKPVNLVCMGVNYQETVPLAAVQIPRSPGGPPPMAFLKSPSAVIGDGEEMILPDIGATHFEAEAEFAVVIGRRARNVSPAEAMSHVFGYTAFIDGSARGLPPGQNLLMLHQMKSYETFGPMGPYIVTPDELSMPTTVKLWNNGQLMQDFSTQTMTHDVAACIAFASSVHTLEPGDIIATGTDHGGLHAVQDGDLLELEIDGWRRLRIRVRDDLKRTWSRETRFERHQKGASGPPRQLSGKYSPAPSSR